MGLYAWMSSRLGFGLETEGGYKEGGGEGGQVSAYVKAYVIGPFGALPKREDLRPGRGSKICED